MPKGYGFTPRFPEKYAGDPRRIVARSKWELVYMDALDRSNLIKKWISEPKTLNITYVSPIDRKVHEYWPDFLIQYIDGTIEIVEVKPMKETVSNSTKTYDKLMLIKNKSKWEAASKFAAKIGARFRVVTEAQLLGQKSKGKK